MSRPFGQGAAAVDRADRVGQRRHGADRPRPCRPPGPRRAAAGRSAPGAACARLAASTSCSVLAQDLGGAPLQGLGHLDQRRVAVVARHAAPARGWRRARPATTLLEGGHGPRLHHGRSRRVRDAGSREHELVPVDHLGRRRRASAARTASDLRPATRRTSSADMAEMPLPTQASPARHHLHRVAGLEGPLGSHDAHRQQRGAALAQRRGRPRRPRRCGRGWAWRGAARA